MAGRPILVKEKVEVYVTQDGDRYDEAEDALHALLTLILIEMVEQVFKLTLNTDEAWDFPMSTETREKFKANLIKVAEIIGEWENIQD